jgi:DHA1 family tetracycline resistance protein-like MFS transporter
MMETRPTAPAASRAAFGFVFVVVLIDMLSFGLIIPVLPKLIKEFEAGDAARTAYVLGVFGTVWALMQFLCSPITGALSDRFGRRPVLLLSMAGLGIDFVFMAVAPSLTLLFFGRVLSGITTSSYSTAGAYIADVTPPEQRAARFGKLGAAFGLGFVVGPVAGGFLGSAHLRAPFWAAAGLALVNSAYGFFVLPESLPKERRAPFKWSRANPVGSFNLLRSHHELLGLAAVLFLIVLAHNSHPVIFVLYSDARFGWGPRAIGGVLALVGVSTMIVQAGLVGRIVRWIGERKALLSGMLFGTSAFTITAFANTGAMFLMGIPVGAFFGTAMPSLQGLMTRRVAPTEQGRLQGANASVMGVASMVAPALYTQAFALGIDPARGVNVPGLPYFVAAFLLVSAGTLAWYVTRARREASP